MAFYQKFVSATTAPDPTTLQRNLRVNDATIGVVHDFGASNYTLKKTTPWTQAQIAQAQALLDAAPVVTPQSIAQARIDALPLDLKAIVLLMLDQINVLRTAAALPQITPDQALTALRAKAGAIS